MLLLCESPSASVHVFDYITNVQCGQDVDATIVFIFALFGLLFDIVSMCVRVMHVLAMRACLRQQSLSTQESWGQRCLYSLARKPKQWQGFAATAATTPPSPPISADYPVIIVLSGGRSDAGDRSL